MTSFSVYILLAKSNRCAVIKNYIALVFHVGTMSFACNVFFCVLVFEFTIYWQIIYVGMRLGTIG